MGERNGHAPHSLVATRAGVEGADTRVGRGTAPENQEAADDENSEDKDRVHRKEGDEDGLGEGDPAVIVAAVITKAVVTNRSRSSGIAALRAGVTAVVGATVVRTTVVRAGDSTIQ